MAWFEPAQGPRFGFFTTFFSAMILGTRNAAPHHACRSGIVLDYRNTLEAKRARNIAKQIRHPVTE
jgi:hypothetical protein